MKVLQIISNCLLLLSLPALSQTVEYRAQLTLIEAPATGGYNVGDQYTIQIAYNPASLTGVGAEFINASNGLEYIRFEFNGHVYDESFEIASGYPRLYFQDGKFANFDYWNSTGIIGGSPDSFFRFFRDQSFMYSPDGSSEFEGSYATLISTAPEPQVFISIGIGAICLLFVRNRITRI